MTTPTNKGLTDNLLPLWTGRELTEQETLKLLEEVEGKTSLICLVECSDILKNIYLN